MHGIRASSPQRRPLGKLHNIPYVDKCNGTAPPKILAYRTIAVFLAIIQLGGTHGKVDTYSYTGRDDGGS